MVDKYLHMNLVFVFSCVRKYISVPNGCIENGNLNARKNAESAENHQNAPFSGMSAYV
jgi:hypothetical protein